MAGTDGQTPDTLTEKMFAEPHSFDFYAAVRLLQSRSRDFPRVGHSRSPSEDPIRFAQSPSLAFASSTIESIKQNDTTRVPVMFTRHFGLFGPNGPLPLCLTEFARERLQHGDHTFTAFCNIFHHRMLSFFFRAWADSRKQVDYDRPQDQHWTSYVGSLVGLGMDSLLHRDSVPDKAKLFYSARLSPQARNAEGLGEILQDFFGIKTEVQTFVGKWISLPPNSTCRLGASASTGTLGSSTIVGTRTWTCQMNFRLRMGPMRLVDLERLLPNGAAFRRLRDWVRNYDGEEHGWDVQFVLLKEEVPQTRLGGFGQLGWTTWIKTKPFTEDAEDLFLTPP